MDTHEQFAEKLQAALGDDKTYPRLIYAEFDDGDAKYVIVARARVIFSTMLAGRPVATIMFGRMNWSTDDHQLHLLTVERVKARDDSVHFTAAGDAAQAASYVVWYNAGETPYDSDPAELARARKDIARYMPKHPEALEWWDTAAARREAEIREGWGWPAGVMRATIRYCIEYRMNAAQTAIVPAGLWYFIEGRGWGCFFLPEFGGDEEQARWETVILDDWHIGPEDPAVLPYIAQRTQQQTTCRGPILTLDKQRVAAFLKNPGAWMPSE